MRERYAKILILAPVNLPHEFGNKLPHCPQEDLTIDVHHRNFGKIPTVLQGFAIVHPTFVSPVIVEDILVPAGEKIEAPGHQVFVDDAVICVQRENRSSPGKEEGNILVFIEAKIYQVKRIELPALKKVGRAVPEVDFDGIIALGGIAIIEMTALIVVSIHKLGVQPQDIAIGPQHELCLGNVEARQIQEDDDIGILFHFRSLCRLQSFFLRSYAVPGFSLRVPGALVLRANPRSELL